MKFVFYIVSFNDVPTKRSSRLINHDKNFVLIARLSSKLIQFPLEKTRDELLEEEPQAVIQKLGNHRNVAGISSPII